MSYNLKDMVGVTATPFIYIDIKWRKRYNMGELDVKFNARRTRNDKCLPFKDVIETPHGTLTPHIEGGICTSYKIQINESLAEPLFSDMVANVLEEALEIIGYKRN